MSQGTKQAFTKKGEQPTLATCFAGGAAAGAGFWGAWYPLETLKTRMQVSRPIFGVREERWMDCSTSCCVSLLETSGVEHTLVRAATFVYVLGRTRKSGQILFLFLGKVARLR